MKVKVAKVKVNGEGLIRVLFALALAASAGCALTPPTAGELGERYWRTKREADREAWMAALDREGHDFSTRYEPDYGERGIYKFNRDSKLACFVITREIAERLGHDSFDAETDDGPVHFEWRRLDDGTVESGYTAPTNWEVFVQAHGAKGERNPKSEANIHFWTSVARRGVVSLEMAHHRPDWAAGPYAKIPFPTNQVKAVNNFAYGTYAGLGRLGFGREGSMAGTVGIGTFDTNFPDGHADFPPHFHIIPTCRDGIQVHHLYARAEDGRITSDCFQDMSRVVDVWDRAVEFKPGDEFPCYDDYGRVAFRVRILPDGTGLELSTPDRSRRVRVSGERPCESVEIAEAVRDGWKSVQSVAVTDDPYAGVLTTPEGTVRYDPASGAKRPEPPADGVIDVRTFGARGDGETADSAACQAALDAAGRCGGTVFFPPGVYLVHDLKVPARVALKADPKWLFRPETAGAVLKLDDPGARCVLDITGAYGVRLSGLFIDGIPDAPKDVHGILLDNPTEYSPKEDSPVVEDVRVQRFSGDGIHFNRVWCFFIRHSMSAYNRGNGVYLRGWDGFVVDNQFSGNWGHGFVSDLQGSTVMFTSNRIEWNRKCGLCVEPGFGNSWNVTGNSFDRNFQSNLSMANVQGSTVTGNLFRRAGRDLDASEPWGAPTAQVRLKNCRGVTVTGNTLEAGQDDDGVGVFSPAAGFVIEKLGWCTIRGNTLFHGYLKEPFVDRGGHEQTDISDNPSKPLPIP